MTVSVPAEWSPHQAMWLGFPSHADLWEDDLEAARAEVTALARALAGPGKEQVRLLTCGDEAANAARAAIDGAAGIEIVRGQFGDIWLRDTGPIFVHDGDTAAAASFQFNGWGGKYVLDDDDLVAEQIAAAAGAPLKTHPFVLEGGALDHDGFGAVLTTRQCLVNPNRNPGWTQNDAEAALKAALGAQRCCGWATVCSATTPTAMSTTWRGSSRRAWSPVRWPGAATTPMRRSTTRPRASWAP